MLHIRVHFILLLALAVQAEPLLGASFDCTRASSEVERVVCSDSRVSKLDEDYANQFRSAIANASDPESVRANGRAWLRVVRDACSSAECLVDAYSTRILELQASSHEQSPTGGWVAPSTSVDLTLDSAAERAADMGDESSRTEAGKRGRTQALVDASDAPTQHSGVTQRANPRGLAPIRASSLQVEIESAVWWGILISTLLLLGLAITNRVVVFHDLVDAAWGVGVVIATAAATYIWLRIQPDSEQSAPATLADYVGLGIFIAGALCCMAQTLHFAIRYNRSFAIGIFVGIFKVGASFALAVTSLGLLGRILDGRSSRSQVNIAAMLLALVGVLWFALINGERVVERRNSLVN